MVVRPMVMEDARDVADLCGQLGYPSSEGDVRSRLSSLLGEPEQGIFVAEAPDGKVVGWIHVLGTCLLESEPFAEIGGLVVDKDRRGTEAHQFYLKLGYQTVKTQFAFHKNLR
jgi:hypothetical protein